VKGLTKLEKDSPTCDACQYEKLSRFPFNKARHEEPHKSYNWYTQMLKDQWTRLFKWQCRHSTSINNTIYPSVEWCCGERKKNKKVIEMTRWLLHDKGLPKKFWAKAVNIIIFLLNRLPTKALQTMTPFRECLAVW